MFRKVTDLPNDTSKGYKVPGYKVFFRAAKYIKKISEGAIDAKSELTLTGEQTKYSLGAAVRLKIDRRQSRF